MHYRTEDISGRKFGNLTVVQYAGSNGHKSLFLCECVCGNQIIRPATEIKRKRGLETRSCGCMKGENLSKSRERHGLSNSAPYHAWRNAKDRCRNPRNQAYSNYGGRGIDFYAGWDKFDDFWKDMGPTWAEGLTLDRIDNNKGYGPGNCRWATVVEQSLNRRTNRFVDTPWGILTVSEASRRSGIKVTTLLYRLDRTTDPDKLFAPVKNTNREL